MNRPSTTLLTLKVDRDGRAKASEVTVGAHPHTAPPMKSFKTASDGPRLLVSSPASRRFRVSGSSTRHQLDSRSIEAQGNGHCVIATVRSSQPGARPGHPRQCVRATGGDSTRALWVSTFRPFAFSKCRNCRRRRIALFTQASPVKHHSPRPDRAHHSTMTVTGKKPAPGRRPILKVVILRHEISE